MGHEDAAAPSEVLNSWKEIAAYLDKDVRTVMRWEQNLALPVRRLPGGPKARVYALKSELDAWRGRVAVPADATGNEGARARRVPGTSALGTWGKSVLVATCLLGVTVLVAYWVLARTAKVPETARMTRLTYERFAAWPAISADGKLFAYASNREGKSDIYLQQIGGHQPVRISQNNADNWQPALSPDGLHVAFRSDRDGGGLYVVEAFGGAEMKIADRGAFPRFSPDGKTLVYLVRDAFSGTAKVFLVPAAGGVPRAFQPDFLVPPVGTLYAVPMWSPDGGHILFEGVRGERGLWVAPVAGGDAVPLQGVPNISVGRIRIYAAWAGGYLYYVEGTSVHGAPLMRVPIASMPWRVSGPPEQLTSSSTVCGIAAVSADGRLILQVSSGFVNTIWSLPLRSESAEVGGSARQETPDAYNQLRMSVASGGSRFAYVGNPERGKLEVWLVDTVSRRMTVVPVADNTRVPYFQLSPDGARLAYRDYVNSRPFSYVVAAENPAAGDPVCGDCLVLGFFSASRDLLVAENTRIMRQDASNGARTEMVVGQLSEPVLSPDDNWLAFVAPRPDGAAGLFVARVGGRPTPAREWILVDEDRNFIGAPRWSPSGGLLYYISNRDSSSCVWARAFNPAAGTFGEPIHVYHDPGVPSVKTSTTKAIGVTPDRLYILMATAESNIWTMRLDDR